MKKNSIVLSLIMISLFSCASQIKAEDFRAGEVEDQEQQEVKNENETEKKKFEASMEAAKLAKEIAQKEREKQLENLKSKKEELKLKAENLREAKSRAVEKKAELKSEILDAKEALREDSEKSASGSAREHMSEVAKEVNKLLQMRADDRGIGQKVREVAQEQVQSQERIMAKLAKMEAKKVWVKKMLGYDKEAVLSVQEEIDANRLRIQELQKLQEETKDPSQMAELETAVNSLVDQNAVLDSTIQEEMHNQGVWGWFRNLMRRD